MTTGRLYSDNKLTTWLVAGAYAALSVWAVTAFWRGKTGERDGRGGDSKR